MNGKNSIPFINLERIDGAPMLDTGIIHKISNGSEFSAKGNTSACISHVGGHIMRLYAKISSYMLCRCVIGKTVQKRIDNYICACAHAVLHYVKHLARV